MAFTYEESLGRYFNILASHIHTSLTKYYLMSVWVRYVNGFIRTDEYRLLNAVAKSSN